MIRGKSAAARFSSMSSFSESRSGFNSQSLLCGFMSGIFFIRESDLAANNTASDFNFLPGNTAFTGKSRKEVIGRIV
jgi:hypothetical protein